MIDTKCFTSCEKLTNLCGVLVRHSPPCPKPSQQSAIAKRATVRLLSLHTHIRHNYARSTQESASAGQGGLRSAAPETRQNSQHLTNKHLRTTQVRLPVSAPNVPS